MSGREPFPMFPLGTVLLPTAVLPLHVFEPRYRALVKDCLERTREFGVTLIERGSEVGGDDIRTSVGTVAQILEAQESPDGRWLLGTVGTRRLRVTEWLADDPYPRAHVEDWPEPAVHIDLGAQRADVLASLTRVFELAGRLGDGAARPLPDTAADPALASYQLSALAPLGPLDQQALLAAAGPAERLAMLAGLLEELVGDLLLRLELDGD